MFKMDKDYYDYFLLFNKFYHLNDKKYYRYTSNIEAIAKHLSISIEDFIADLKKFNAYTMGNPSYLNFYFHEQDIIEYVEYLNIKYAILFKLTGD